jgi:hypothetical protein
MRADSGGASSLDQTGYSCGHNYLETSQYHEAISTADSILSENFVDINAHLYCGYAYRQIKDTTKADFHYSIYEELIKSISASGDGRSPGTAFIVITTKEEYAFIDALGLDHTQQSLSTKDGHFFDILETTDRETKEKYTIYFNIDIPYGYLNKMFK